jgi:hypothetical protein
VETPTVRTDRVGADYPSVLFSADEIFGTHTATGQYTAVRGWLRSGSARPLDEVGDPLTGDPAQAPDLDTAELPCTKQVIHHCHG